MIMGPKRLRSFLSKRLNLSFNNFLFAHLRNTCVKYVKKYKRPFYDTISMIALTYQCQCKCAHCGSGFYKQEQKNELRRNEIMQLINEFGRLGSKEIYFFGGEPLLVPELIDYIRYAKLKDLKVHLDTNGFLLDETMVKKLKEAGVYLIRVSIDSPYENAHDKFRGVHGIFKRAIAGIKYCKKHNVNCCISTFATKDNLRNGELEKIINLAKKLGVTVRILSPILCGKWSNRNDLVLSPQEITLLRSFLEKSHQVFWEKKNVDSKESPFFCAAFKKMMFYISAYGDVQPCCYYPVSFGNIREKPLRSILKMMWNSDMFVKQETYNDCPTNSERFSQRYGRLIEVTGQCPQKFYYH